MVTRLLATQQKREMTIPSQKKISFTEKFAAMVWLIPKDEEVVIAGIGKSKTFEAVSAMTTETGKEGEKAATPQWLHQKSQRDRR